jgi:hypothetical protein
MALASVPALVLAVITGSVGVFYLAFYFEWRAAREHLAFALLCFAVAAYDAFSAALYGASSLAEGVVWQRLQLIVLALAGGLTVWFVELVTLGKLTRTGRAFVAVLAALIVLMLVLDVPGITPAVSTPAVKVVRWGERALVTYYESELGPVATAGILVVYLAYLRLFVLLFRSYRTDRSPRTLGIIGGQVAYFVGLLNDGLVGSGAYSFVYVSEYAYLIVIFTMANALLGRFVDLHRSVEALNAGLERRVREALADVKVLRGLIPICASCKKIRDDQGFWTRIEEYLTDHSEATLSHGICPDCVRKLYPDIAAKLEAAAAEPKSDE